MKPDLFKLTTITITFFVAFLLLLVSTSLFWMISPSEFWQSLISEEMIFSLLLSLKTATFASLIILVLAIPMGYSLARYDFFAAGFIKTIVNLPLAFPQLVLGLCLLILFSRTGISDFFSMIGIKLEFSQTAIVIAQVFTALPAAVQMMIQTFTDINPQYETIARSLGYSHSHTFFKVSLPLAKNGMISSLILAFARSIGSFGAVLILAGGTRMKTAVLPVTLYLNFSYGNINMAVSAGILLIIISFVVISVVQKLGKIK